MSEMSVHENGEVAGSFLLGLVASFSHLNIVPEELRLEHVDPHRWYPYAKLIASIDLIQSKVHNSSIILFYAGISFMQIWYRDGPGKNLIRSSLDWLYINEASGGYNSVVRGGDKADIGWSLLVSVDEEAGVAVYENVMPLPPDFVRGVFYGGCQIFDDMEYVEVESTSEPFPSNRSFNKFNLTVRFKRRSEPASKAVDAHIRNFVLDEAKSLDTTEIETLIWRNKGMQVKIELEMEYHKAIGALLADALSAARQTTRELAKRNVEIEYLANHDTLTGLPTRRLAMDRLRTMQDADPTHRARVALLFIDLDGFKACNDSFGHDAGDHVLRMVADRVLKCLRRGDLVARLGGDEFLVIISGEDKSGLRAIASKIIHAIAQPISFREHWLQIGCSIGISLANDATVPEDLIRKADTAMYHAKARGNNKFMFLD